MNSAVNSETVAKHVRFVCGLDEELSGAFLSMLYGEPVTALEHVALVAGGDIQVPPAERMAQAAAEVAGFAGYRYVTALPVWTGDLSAERDFLLAAAELYAEVCTPERRRAAETDWSVAEATLAFAGAFEEAAVMAVKEGEAWKEACAALDGAVERLIGAVRELFASEDLFSGLEGVAARPGVPAAAAG